MRDTLFNLVKDTIVYQYDLPHSSKGIHKTIFTTDEDKCYLSENIDNIIKIIYNAVIEYSFNELDIESEDFQSLHAKALQTKMKYSPDDALQEQLKYGFFGEVLLYAVLHVLFNSIPLISRGYFFNPLENSETKGYDSYHLVETEKNVELWFGEVKFHKSYTTAINSALDNIDKALSDNYLKKNILALTDKAPYLNYKGSKIETIIEKWNDDPLINIIDEMKKFKMKLIYPIMLIYQFGDDDYDSNIKKVPEYIFNEWLTEDFNLSVEHSIFFILLPLKEVREIKKEVIEWIKSKKPLMS